MFLGVLVAMAEAPNPCDINGNPKGLKELGKGKAYRLMLARDKRRKKVKTAEGHLGSEA
jgi:hypothetical protein